MNKNIPNDSVELTEINYKDYYVTKDCRIWSEKSGKYLTPNSYGKVLLQPVSYGSNPYYNNKQMLPIYELWLWAFNPIKFPRTYVLIDSKNKTITYTLCLKHCNLENYEKVDICLKNVQNKIQVYKNFKENIAKKLYNNTLSTYSVKCDEKYNNVLLKKHKSTLKSFFTKALQKFIDDVEDNDCDIVKEKAIKLFDSIVYKNIFEFIIANKLPEKDILFVYDDVLNRNFAKYVEKKRNSTFMEQLFLKVEEEINTVVNKVIIKIQAVETLDKTVCAKLKQYFIKNIKIINKSIIQNNKLWCRSMDDLITIYADILKKYFDKMVSNSSMTLDVYKVLHSEIIRVLENLFSTTFDMNNTKLKLYKYIIENMYFEYRWELLTNDDFESIILEYVDDYLNNGIESKNEQQTYSNQNYPPNHRFSQMY